MPTRRMQSRFTSLFVFAAATALSLACVKGALAYDIEDVLSAPYAESLVRAQNADRIAWIETARGARSVWTAAAPDFEPQQLANFPNDDGRPLSQLSLSRDGKYAVFTRGGSKNWNGEHPNPDSDPDGATQTVWIAPVPAKQARMIADGANPKLSPSGETVLIQRDGEVYEYLTRSRKPKSDDPLFTVRGAVQNIEWSPDGEKILFVSVRESHSLVGVFDIEERQIRWMGPSVYRDMHAVWSPDGREVAFLRRPGRLNGERPHLMTAWPFSIMVADAATGDARQVWRSPGEMAGGLAQRYFPEPLRWTATGVLVFYSEHDGFMRLYSVPAAGGDAVALTPANCEAEDTDITPDGAALIYSHNCGDVDRRHLAVVATDGGEPTALTQGDGIETSPVALSAELVAYRAGGATAPTRIAYLAPGQTPSLISSAPDADFPAADLVIPQQAIFQASDGVTVHGQLFAPPDLSENDKRPALLYLHGGPIRQMLLGWHYRGYYANAYAMNQYLSSQGYVVLAVNFRAGIGYGRDFRLVPDHGPRGASEYKDVLAAADYLKSLSYVDDERIGLWGGSYGGLLTAQGLARNSDIFAAGVDLHGVHDWSLDFPNVPGRYWGLTPDEMALARKSSPIADIDGWRSPVLFIHGDDDRNVVFWETTDLAMRLDQRGVHWEALVLPDEVHGFYRYASWLATFRATADFFDRMLKE